MHELDDIALLRQYTEQNSEEAFATLVTRHVNNVYSVALRHTRNPYQAEEITQAVFVILARKSPHLGKRVILSGWLYQTTRLAEATLNEGVEPDGGVCYEGKGGKIIDHGKEWWPQAEAVVGFLNAYQLSHEEKHLKAALKVWNYSEKHLVDRAHGEWFWRITPEGVVDPTKPKVSEWKEPYHTSRACLEALRRLAIISAGNKTD
jgi:mannose/cellobiose epimerase-like protein (N-acyl-D-glucosamine 2-epimerase family)